MIARCPLGRNCTRKKTEKYKKAEGATSPWTTFNTPPKRVEAGAIGPNSFRPVKFNAPSRSKRSLVGVGGLEVRVRQRLALTSVCYFIIAHPKDPTKSRLIPKDVLSFYNDLT